ncbi:DUF721 domain-containing protein [bacterium]|nr:MAG: DUF721 domain-containing protein [bacterium]
MSDPAPLSKLLKNFLSEARKNYPEGAHRLYEIWPEAVGPSLARVTRPLSLSAGKLTVAVEGAVWLQELSLFKSQLISNLNERLGKDSIKSVRLIQATIAPEEKPEPPFDKSWLERPLTPEETALIENSLADLPEGEIREALRSAMSAAKKRSSLRDAPADAPPPRNTSARSRGRGE